MEHYTRIEIPELERIAEALEALLEMIAEQKKNTVVAAPVAGMTTVPATVVEMPVAAEEPVVAEEPKAEAKAPYTPKYTLPDVSRVCMALRDADADNLTKISGFMKQAGIASIVELGGMPEKLDWFVEQLISIGGKV